MTAVTFHVYVQYEAGSGSLVLTGELDVATVPNLRAAADGLIGPDLRAVTVDASSMTFCAVQGLVKLDRIRRVSREAGANFTLLGVSPFLLRVMEVVKLRDLAASVDTAQLRTAS